MLTEQHLNEAWNHILDQGEAIDTENFYHWESLAYGFALAHGLTVPEAVNWAIYKHMLRHLKGILE